MNIIGTPLLVVCVLALFAVFAWSARRGPRRSIDLRAFCNVGEKTHRESITKKTDGAYARYLLVKVGSDIDHVALAGLGDQPIGALGDESAAAEDLIVVNMLGQYPGSIKMVANAAITAGSAVYSAALGKVAPLASAGVGAKFVGITLTAAAADGDIIEVMSVLPNANLGAQLVYAGVRTWAAGAAVTEAFTLNGVLATDSVLATPILVAGAGLLQKVVPTANTLTATTNANWGNGDKYYYQVWR